MHRLKNEKISLFSYAISFRNEKIYLNCCLIANADSVHLALDNNFDSIIQDTEIFRYSLNQYENENFSLNFSIKIYDTIEAFMLLSSLKNTSIKINTPDSILNKNPIALQVKNFMHSSFIEGGEKYHITLMNTFPTIGIGNDFKYMITKTKIDEMDFFKIANWYGYQDTVLLNEKIAIVPVRKTDETIRIDFIAINGLYGTFIGAKMPNITALSIDNSMLQLPITRPGNLHLIEFWGTWCGPCKVLYPRLDSLIKDNVHFLSYTGITGSDDKEKVRQYIDKKPTIENQVFEQDNNKSLINLFKIHEYPTFLLVDDRGIIVARMHGSRGLDIIGELINDAKKKANLH